MHVGRLPSLLLLDVATAGLVGGLDLPDDVSVSPLAALRLSGNSLSGSLPQQLASFTALSSLAVDSNLLSGTIPSLLGQVQPLVSLDLQDNALEGTIPGFLCAQSQLRNLNAKGNRLSGSLPPELGECTGFDVRGRRVLDAT
jgi:hypothetical protein